MGQPAQLKTHNGSAYISSKFQNFLATYSIAHTTGIPYHSTGQAVVESANHTLKEMLIKQKGEYGRPRDKGLIELYIRYIF